jgi:hypothetical protein
MGRTGKEIGDLRFELRDWRLEIWGRGRSAEWTVSSDQRKRRGID